MTYAYKALIEQVLTAGEVRKDRTGVGTLSTFGLQLRESLRDWRWPLVTMKAMAIKPMLTELEMFLKGETNIEYLHERGVKLWDPWARPDGEIGPLYGYQWRRWGGDETKDQLAEAVRLIQEDPTSRRIIVSAWNVDQLDEMVLPPCPTLFQFYVRDNKLSMHVYQRSADVFLGVPFDLAQYSLLTHLVADQTGLLADEIVFSFGDAHLYSNHINTVLRMRERQPRLAPTISFNGMPTIDTFTADSVVIHDYNPHPKLTGKVAV